MLLIKRYSEIRIWHFMTYLSVPFSPFKNGLYVSLCVCERKTPKETQRKIEKARASQKKRERERKKERKKVCRGTYNHPPCPCPRHYSHHRRHCHKKLLCRQFLVWWKCQNRSIRPQTQSWMWITPPGPSPPIHIVITYSVQSTLRWKSCERLEQLVEEKSDLQNKQFTW